MGFLKNIVGKAYNQAKTVKNNVKTNLSYTPGQNRAHIKAPAGYTFRGTYGANEITLKYAINDYRRNGYAVAQEPIINNGKRCIRLFIKKAKPIRIQAPAKKKVTGRAKTTKRTTRARKTIPKYLEIAGKRYEKAGSFGGYQDNAKAYASDLKRRGFAVRVKKLIVNSEIVFTVYTRNPSRR